MPEIVIEWIGGLCPVQANGTIDGVPFYFRARGDSWHVEIGEGNTHNIVASMDLDGDTDETERLRALEDETWSYGEDFGAWPEAGYMLETDARAFIRKAAELWCARAPAQADGGAP